MTAMGKEGLYLEDHEDQMSLHRPDHEDMTYNQVRRDRAIVSDILRPFSVV